MTNVLPVSYDGEVFTLVEEGLTISKNSDGDFEFAIDDGGYEVLQSAISSFEAAYLVSAMFLMMPEKDQHLALQLMGER